MRYSRSIMIFMTLFFIVTFQSKAATVNVPCDAATLSATIGIVSSNVDEDTLQLTSGCTYTLTSPLPALVGTITINGNGATITTAGNFKLLVIQSNATIELRNINFVGGTFGIENYGTLKVYDSMFSNNSDTGLYNQGTVYV